MPRKHHKPEEILAKLRQVDVLTSQEANDNSCLREALPRPLSLGRRPTKPRSDAAVAAAFNPESRLDLGLGEIRRSHR